MAFIALVCTNSFSICLCLYLLLALQTKLNFQQDSAQVPNSVKLYIGLGKFSDIGGQIMIPYKKSGNGNKKRLITHLFCGEISDIFMVLLAPGVENPAQEPVHKDHVHAPVGQRVLVLHVPVSRQHQVDPRFVPKPGQE